MNKCVYNSTYIDVAPGLLEKITRLILMPWKRQYHISKLRTLEFSLLSLISNIFNNYRKNFIFGTKFSRGNNFMAAVRTGK